MILDSSHQQFLINECGLFLHLDYPFIGATPEGLVSCDCCGEGICEIKCPYSCHDECIEESVDKRTSCLEKYAKGNFLLKRNHAYYYQVQCQLFCTNRTYCDFVLWSSKDIHVERIYPDENIWHDSVEKAQHFFLSAVLPEMIGKWFSRPPPVSPLSLTSPDPSSSEPHSPVTTPVDEQYCY